MVWVVSLSTTELIPRCLTPRALATVIRGLVGVGKRRAPEPIQCPTDRSPSRGLHLNAFRGEPAISEFAWRFTALHSSSNWFVTQEGSGLHARLDALHPGHGEITRFR